MSARSYLYVPGDRPDRLDKAVQRAGDAIIADLEDAVAEDRKDLALDAILAWAPGVPADGPEVWVRINPGARAADELAALAGVARLTGVVLAKADGAGLDRAAAVLPARVALAALVETAAALLELPALAAHPRVRQLGLGEADLAAELGIARDEPAVLGPIRAMAVIASAAAGKGGPTGPVHLDVRDLDGLRTSTEELRRRGFAARSAIHPDQVAIIESVFTPTADDVAEARATVAAWDSAGAGVALDARGRMVDEAVVRLSRRTVATAERLGL